MERVRSSEFCVEYGVLFQVQASYSSEISWSVIRTSIIFPLPGLFPELNSTQSSYQGAEKFPCSEWRTFAEKSPYFRAPIIANQRHFLGFVMETQVFTTKCTVLLLDFFTGEVLRFLPLNPKAVLFLPQKTFLTDGTLRQQVNWSKFMQKILNNLP